MEWLIGLGAAGGAAIITYLAMRLQIARAEEKASRAGREEEAARWSQFADNLTAKQEKVAEAWAEVETKLEQISELDKESARELYLQQHRQQLEASTRALRKEWETASQAEIDALATAKLLAVLERRSATIVNQITTILVPIPNEEMKGRLIGREGRNIRSFEQTTGVDLIIDETPEAVMLSSFDPLRREIAKLTLLNLMLDGRIHPTRIEELHQRASEEVHVAATAEGQQAAESLRIHDLKPEVIRVLGNLRFRASLGQNVLDHSVETARIAGMLAQELKRDPIPIIRAALLHDIGKALGDEWEDTHALAGMKFLSQQGESEEITHAVGAHHYEIEPQSETDLFVIIADSISASRPGARRETADNFIQRIEELEKLANQLPGVIQALAIQAGRELRIIVDPIQMDDNAAKRLAQEVVKKIESSSSRHGRVKVTVIRETRVTETSA